MAETFTNEGLTHVFAHFPRVSSAPASNLYLTMFFTSASTVSASVVPASESSASPIVGWVEASPLTRVVVAASHWTVPSVSGAGMRSTACQYSFAAFATAPASAIAGFALVTASVGTSTGDKVLFFSNFDDRTLITAGASDIVKVTPTWGFDA
jgi:hypothetical protein